MDYLFIKAPANLEGAIHPELSFVGARQVRSIMGGRYWDYCLQTYLQPVIAFLMKFWLWNCSLMASALVRVLRLTHSYLTTQKTKD